MFLALSPRLTRGGASPFSTFDMYRQYSPRSKMQLKKPFVF